MEVITITPTDDGPYLVRGGAALLDADGAAYEVGETIALCRCGQSSTKPSCDGAHERAKFRPPIGRSASLSCGRRTAGRARSP